RLRGLVERAARPRGDRARPPGGIAVRAPERDDARGAPATAPRLPSFRTPGGLRPVAAGAGGGGALRQAAAGAAALARPPRAPDPHRRPLRARPPPGPEGARPRRAT